MNVQVVISGPVFAQLLHSHIISPNNQEGLLLGEVIERRVNQINDQAAVNELEEVIIKVCSYVPCEPFELYRENLQIDTDASIRIMSESNRGTQIIGYYSFRRNLPLTASLRDRHVATALAMETNGTPFVFGLFSATFNGNFSIHSLEHSFQSVTPMHSDRTRATFEPASLRVVNLGEDARQEYRTLPGAAVSLQQGTFSNFVKSINYNGRNDQSVEILNRLHREVQRKLESLATDITDNLQLHEVSYEQAHA